MKPNQKRIVLELDAGLHTTLKVIAAQNHMTLKNWLLLAIAEKLNNKKPKDEHVD